MLAPRWFGSPRTRILGGSDGWLVMCDRLATNRNFHFDFRGNVHPIPVNMQCFDAILPAQLLAAHGQAVDAYGRRGDRPAKLQIIRNLGNIEK